MNVNDVILVSMTSFLLTATKIFCVCCNGGGSSTSCFTMNKYRFFSKVREKVKFEEKQVNLEFFHISQIAKFYYFF